MKKDTEFLKELLAGKRDSYSLEKRYIRKDGRTIWGDQSVGLIRDEQGNASELVCTVADITERKKAEQALIESEEKYRRFYEDAPLGYQSLDASGKFLDVNKEWLSVLGCSKEEVIGRCFADFVAPEYLENFAENFPRFKADGSTRGTEFEMLRKDGSHITVSFDGNIEYDTDGHFRRTHCIMHDITERRKAQEAMRLQYNNLTNIMDSMADGV